MLETAAAALPAETTSFVGRRFEVAEARRLLSRSRLLTLTGVGGVGKTRLARRLAKQMSRMFPDGVRLVDLTPIVDGRLVAPTVAQALGLAECDGDAGVEAVAVGLAEKRALLVLDNCEHLVEACARFAAAALQAAPGLRILATSRETLSVAGESVLPVPPLSVPPVGATLSPAELDQYDAVRLFTERAGALVPGFEVGDGNAAAVATLCQRLDGIPFEIETAALWLRALPVQEIVERLANRFRLLTPPCVARQSHRRGARESAEWSAALCAPHERALWARLSVFPGAFSLDAAEAVGAGGAMQPDDVLHFLTRLVDKSILVRVDQDSNPRYRLLESIREYGRELLTESGEEADVVLRYHGWCRFSVTPTTGQSLNSGKTDANERTAMVVAPPAKTSDQNVLTPRERQVADLVSQGLTNKKIAETLVISLRTADAHVEHILVKLGFHSRAQIASWVTAHAG